jgi:TRAP-type uncharacterized transport system fused permease subunit
MQSSEYFRFERTYAGLVRMAVGAIAVAMALYHMWIIATGTPEAMLFRGTHLLFAMTLVYLLYRGNAKAEGTPALLDYALLGLTAAAILYLFVNYEYIVTRIYYVDDLAWADMALAVLLVLLILDATRRLIGWALPITAAIFLFYALVIAGVELERLLDQLYMTTEGIFGPTLGVSATYVIIFVLFGSFM